MTKKQEEKLKCTIHGKVNAISFINDDVRLARFCFICFVEALKKLGLTDYAGEVESE